MPFFTSDGVNIHVDISGSGPAVLFLHELTLDHRQWTEQKEALRGTRRVFRFDFRGHGRSARDATGHSWSVWAADVQRGLVQFGMDLKNPGVLVAHGHACEVALRVALAEPRRLAALLLVTPILPGVPVSTEWKEHMSSVRQASMSGDVDEAMARLRRDPSYAGVRSQSTLERAVKEMQQSFFGAALRVLDGDDGDPSFPRLEECSTPALILRAEKDRDDFKEIASALSQRLPHGRLQTCDGVAHFPNLEAPQEFQGILSRWLDESLPRS